MLIFFVESVLKYTYISKKWEKKRFIILYSYFKKRKTSLSWYETTNLKLEVVNSSLNNLEGKGNVPL